MSGRVRNRWRMLFWAALSVSPQQNDCLAKCWEWCEVRLSLVGAQPEEPQHGHQPFGSEASGRYRDVTSSVTRRFCIRPSSVALSATGRLSPNPSESTRSALTPFLVNASATDSARALDNSMLAAELPPLSVCPPTVT